jgi:membrane-associated phospholipid phosphatase
VIAAQPQAPEQSPAAETGDKNEKNDSGDKQEKKQEKKQETDAKKPPTPERTGISALFGNLAGDYTHLAHRDNFYVAALGGGLALAVHPLDANFNVHLRSHYTTVNRAYAPAKYVGNTPEQIALSLGTFATGRIIGSDKTSHLGMDLLRAQILTESIVEPIKLAVQRERPDGSNNLSFPSGHSAITFAAATVIERHLGWRQSILGYAIASYVASSRIHDNVHYLSDVVFGAAIGTIAGRTVTQHGRSYWTFVPTAVPGGGIAVLAIRRAPDAADR